MLLWFYARCAMLRQARHGLTCIKRPRKEALYHSLVEPEGFEPSSKHVTHKLSTRLFCHCIVGPQPEDRHPNYGLSCCFLPVHRNTAQASLIYSRLPDPILKARTGGNRMLLIFLIRQPLQSCSYCHLKVDGRDLRGNQQSPTCLLTDLPRCQNQSTPVNVSLVLALIHLVG